MLPMLAVIVLLFDLDDVFDLEDEDYFEDGEGFPPEGEQAAENAANDVVYDAAYDTDSSLDTPPLV